MLALRQLLLAASLASAALAQPAATDPDPARLLPFDPVLLCQGREVTGDPSLTLTEGPYTYRFTDASSRDTFLADPDRYEIQFNGACARMGPLGGPVDARRFAVHEEKIYLFASESCRNTFLNHADKLLERDDRALLPAGCEADRARELLTKAIEWTGGPDALAAVRTYVERRAIPYESAQVTMDHHLTVAIEFAPDSSPARYYRQDDWQHYGAWGEAMVLGHSCRVERDGQDGPIEATPFAATQHRHLERQIAKNLLVVLRAAALPDTASCRIALGDVDGIPTEEVAIHHDGVTATLSIDPQTGRILALSHTARGGPSGLLGTRRFRFTEFDTVAGLRLPTAATASFDGVPEPSADFAGTAIEINAALDPAWFAGLAADS